MCRSLAVKTLGIGEASHFAVPREQEAQTRHRRRKRVADCAARPGDGSDFLGTSEEPLNLKKVKSSQSFKKDFTGSCVVDSLRQVVFAVLLGRARSW